MAAGGGPIGPRVRVQPLAFIYMGGKPLEDCQAPGPEQGHGWQFRIKNLPEAISKGSGSCWVETGGGRQTT